MNIKYENVDMEAPLGGRGGTSGGAGAQGR
jgi:hypothetical protein